MLRISGVEVLHASAGARYWSYVAVRTDAGHTGWAEISDGGLSGIGLAGVVERLGALLVGEDAAGWRRVEQLLRSRVREAEEGLNRRATGALVNACLDAAARAEGASVAQLLGGALREEIPLYWSHCGLGRIRLAEAGLAEPLRTLDDVRAMGAQVAAAGYRALKTNLMLLDGDAVRLRLPAWGGPGWPAVELDRELVAGVVDVVAALREGAGPGVDVFLDANFNVKGDGIERLARTLADAGVAWLEVDADDVGALARARSVPGIRIASCETLSGRRAYRRVLEAGAVDVPIVDVAWNGLLESLRIADIADDYDLNVAPHNYGSHLLTHMSAQYAAVAPNVAILEVDVDAVPWRDDLVTPPAVKDGTLTISTAPGWGCEVDEDALRAHPMTNGGAR
ncbi:mandelate racemase/muconate lactonizing enzyme family protein [Nocardioides sp. DS6]|uniref:glucarate dehydratase n=1 Tax=Nocardioides eburneus TaxID=3231482 RepID=A0ABV3T1X7_9ACTN